MNCNTFKKRLEDYLEDNLHNDMKAAMDNHLHNCENCKKAYDEEKEFEYLFKSALAIDATTFNSSRSEIIRGIDKNKYSKNPFSKIKYHFHRQNIRYLSTAAIITITLLLSPQFSGSINNIKSIRFNNKIMAKNTEDLKVKESADIKQADANSKEEAKAEGIVASKTIEAKNFTRVPSSFTKEEISYDIEPEFSTPWENSEDKRYSACIEGKGPEAGEEGIAQVYIKDHENKRAWKYAIVNKDTQDTPMDIEWADKDNIFLIVGLGYGTVSQGGDVYLLNIANAKTSLVYETQKPYEQVTSIVNKNNFLQLGFVVYDNNMDNYSKSIKEIKYEDATRLVSESTELLRELAEEINLKKYEAATKKFGYTNEDKTQKYLGDLKAIEKMDIIKIIDITDTSLFKINGFYDYKVYALEVNYHLNESIGSPLKESTNHQRFILAKENKDSSWKVVQVLTPPQN